MVVGSMVNAPILDWGNLGRRKLLFKASAIFFKTAKMVYRPRSHQVMIGVAAVVVEIRSAVVVNPTL